MTEDKTNVAEATSTEGVAYASAMLRGGGGHCPPFKPLISINQLNSHP